GFHVRREHRAPRRHPLGQWHRGFGRNGENALMRIEREHELIVELARARFDAADDRIAVFDRKRKCAGHERRAHALEFAAGRFSGEHQALGAAAERAVEGAHAHFVRSGLRDGLLANLGTAGADIPQCGSVSPVPRHFRSRDWTCNRPTRYIVPRAKAHPRGEHGTCRNGPAPRRPGPQLTASLPAQSWARRAMARRCDAVKRGIGRCRAIPSACTECCALRPRGSTGLSLTLTPWPSGCRRTASPAKSTSSKLESAESTGCRLPTSPPARATRSVGNTSNSSRTNAFATPTNSTTRTCR